MPYSFVNNSADDSLIKYCEHLLDDFLSNQGLDTVEFRVVPGSKSKPEPQFNYYIYEFEIYFKSSTESLKYDLIDKSYSHGIVGRLRMLSGLSLTGHDGREENKFEYAGEQLNIKISLDNSSLSIRK